ncbi:putative Ig domain-containing protein [Tellurirhabdus bombi]|uniref:putative Ig domain-containing protein n=1 Tax=Tellurirhabdus bombi TaxID=2907205 RepID=UPI001F453C39|nr:putative Ig domain-containing protein [Tellurirhabdus bombi]
MRLLPKLLLQLAMIASPLYTVAQLQISDPKTRAVFQRNNQNQAVIPVKGTCAAGTNRVEARLVARDNQGTSTDWKVIDYTIENNQFSGGLAGSAGWYNLEIRSLSTSGVTAASTLERVGIGEVFIIAGHSVSQGNETSTDGTAEDRVNQVYQPYDANFQDYERTANPEKLSGLVFSQYNNSARPGPFGYNPHIWGKFGEYVAQRYNVPVLIFNAAFGGTNLEHWAKSAQGLPFEHSFVHSSIRMPYINVKNTLDRYVRYLGVRAILCDHGQNDYQNQNVSQLLDYYKTWVAQARNDLGYAPLAVMINRATPQILPSQPNQPIIKFPHIRSVQEQMSQQPNAFPGPDYDTGLASPHRPDGIHLTPDGQNRAGQLWADAVSANFLGASQPWLPGYQETAQQGPSTPPPANTAPTVAQAIPAQTATVGVGYSYAIPNSTFSDAQNNITTYQITGLPAGLSASGLSISGTPTTAGSSTVTVKATDSGNLSVQTTFVLTISPAGTTPPPTNPPPTTAYVNPEGHLDQASCTTASGWAADRGRLNQSISVDLYVDGTLVGTVLANQLRSDLAAVLGDNGLHGFSFQIPAQFQTGGTHTLTVKYAGSDRLLNTASKTYSCAGGSTPPPANTAPTVAQAIPAQAGVVGVGYSYAIPNSTFSDAQNNITTYQVTGLPAGLSASGLSISGTPTTAGSSTVTVKATDSGNLSVQTTFVLTISPAGTTPPPTNPPPTNPPPTTAYVNPEGHLDQASCTTASGWAADRGRLNQSISVDLYVDGTLAGTVLANLLRSDLATHLGDNGLHGFSFQIPTQFQTGGTHTLTVKYAGSDRLLSTASKTYSCAGGSTPPTNTNTAPTVAQAIPAQVGVVGVGYSYSVPNSTFSDAQNNITTYQITGLPAGLSASGLSISGTPTTAGSSTVTVKATDSGNLSVQTTFVLTISPAGTTPPPTNPPPTNPPPSTAYVNPEGHLDQASCTTASGWAADRGRLNQSISVDLYVDGTLAGTVLANLLRSDLATHLGDNGLHGFSFQIPTQFQTGGTHTLTVKYAGSDRLLSTASKTYSCAGGSTPPPANTAPTVAQAIPAQAGVVGVGYSYAIPNSTFSDAQNNITTYQITGLPAGLSASGLSISGTPTTAGSSTVTVKATDSGNLSVQTTFVLTISPAGTTPPPTNPPPTTAYVNPEGHLDQAGCTTASGWAADRGRLNQSISVDLYIDGRLVTTVFANQYRSDLAGVLGDNGLHGFSFQIPTQYRTPGGHTMTAKYAGSDRFLTTSTKSYTCSPSGGRVAAPAEEKATDAEGNWLSYPNPVEDKITVTIPAAFNPSELGYAIASPTGYETPVTPHAVDGQRVVLPVSSLKTGFYILSVKKDGRVIKGLKVFKK